MNMQLPLPGTGLIIGEEKALSKTETSRLSELEQAIEEYFVGFVIVGMSLSEINEKRLYRNQDGRTFDEYCQEAWHINVSRAYQLIRSAAAIENIKQFANSDHGRNVYSCTHSDGEQFSLFPKNESQVRELLKLPAEEQGQFWLEFVDDAAKSNKRLTAPALKKAVQEYKGEKVKKTIEETSPSDEKTSQHISPEFESAWNILWEQVEVERRSNWRHTSKAIVHKRLSILLKAVEDSGIHAKNSDRVMS